MNITETRLPQDGAIKGSIDGTYADMRVSSLPTNLGEKIVIRILDYSMSLKGIEYLGFTYNEDNEENKEKVYRNVEQIVENLKNEEAKPSENTEKKE